MNRSLLVFALAGAFLLTAACERKVEKEPPHPAIEGDARAEQPVGEEGSPGEGDTAGEDSTPDPKLAEYKEEMCPGSSAEIEPSDKVCTTIGCMEGLTVKLPEDLIVEPGTYTITVTSRSSTATCTGSFPVASCDETWTCTSKDKLNVGVSGCAMGADNQKVNELLIQDYPPSLRVAIARGDEELLSQELSPEYVKSQPNGEQCRPVCCSATAEITR